MRQVHETTVLIMYELSIYVSPRLIFHNLTWKFSAFYKFSGKKQVLNIKPKYLLSPSSFFISIIAHELKLSRKCEKVFVFPSRVKILHDIFW